MSIEAENTQIVLLEDLDNSPPVLKGLNAEELLVVVGFSLVLQIVIWIFLSLFLFSKLMVGIPIGVMFGLVQAWVIAGKVAILKQGRPSYMLWGDIKRDLQTKGVSIFGICLFKINFRFIETQVWDNNSHKDGN